MNSMGAILGTTTQELATLGRDAGAAAGGLEGLSAIIQNSSKAVASFSDGTSKGTKKLLEVFALTDDQEAAMRRYGFTLQEAQAEQAYYIELQRTASINMNMQNLSAEKVRTDSLRYAKNLRELSELTGLQSATIKEEQSAAQNDLRNKLRNYKMSMELADLNSQLDGELSAEKRAELEAERDAIKNRMDVASNALREFAGILGAEEAAAIANVIGTGAFDENTKHLATVFGRVGVGAAELENRFKGLEHGSDEYTNAMAQTVMDAVTGIGMNVDSFGDSMENATNAMEIGTNTGLNIKNLDRTLPLMMKDG